MQDKKVNHIAIIMDGNGRWASNQNQERTYGHKYGVQAVKEAIKGSIENEVRYLTLYAFSTENWKRPQEEVDFLMNLLVEAINQELEELHANNVKVHTIGKIEALSPLSQQHIALAKEKTKENTKLNLILALNYGSRDELVEAAKKFAQDCEMGMMKSSDLDESKLERYLYTAEFPDPDILIRTSNEKRISNFLLWQISYTELIFIEKLWPEFTKSDIKEAILEFQMRHRRFGGIKSI
ncbi:MAG: isoprenyl transferase [Chitinophagales bacterium]|jgi:undecaprenyl diphosphate synthase|nr:isoprenyl transferase [Chitinophagales bacterium]